MRKKSVALVVFMAAMMMAVTAFAADLPAKVSGLPKKDLPKTGPEFTLKVVNGHYEVVRNGCMG